ncbi:YbhB/YbcL family Raf kinase inhibitor-like protein [Azospirillum sp. ST 5-10]|uniref:YbhB/YbcL family Raf kinase inhibitor-like protein n=1 Tax=unclassified Azospirillum TaxID=2630922 RepID=UPI003F4A7E9C
MRKAAFILVLAAAVAGPAAAGSFRVAAPGLAPDGTLPDAQVLDGFGCRGGNRSPALTWSEPPAGTRSLAVTVYDPDAPTGSGWWHWTLFNLPPGLRGLPEGGGPLPEGAVQGRTDFGTAGYGGACPPPGDPPHRYVVTVWALDTPALPLDGGAAGAMVGFFLNRHALAKAEVTARHRR